MNQASQTTTMWQASRYQCAECDRALKYPPRGAAGLCKPCGKRMQDDPMMRTAADERAARQALPSPLFQIVTPQADNCPKCGGLAVREHASDIKSGAEVLQNSCINCGRKW